MERNTVQVGYNDLLAMMVLLLLVVVLAVEVPLLPSEKTTLELPCAVRLSGAIVEYQHPLCPIKVLKLLLSITAEVNEKINTLSPSTAGFQHSRCQVQLYTIRCRRYDHASVCYSL